MNAELPPFKNGEHNSENVSTIDPVITPLSDITIWIRELMRKKAQSDS